MTRLGTFVFAVVWALLVVFAVHFLDFPGSVPRFEKVSGGGVLLDAAPAFTVDATYKRLSDYGDEGRKSYALRNVTVDIVLPLSLLPFLFLFMHKAVTSLQVKGFLRGSALSLSFAFVMFDFAENAAVLSLLTNYPARMDLVAGVLPYVTSVKRATSLLALVVPLALFGIRFLRGRPLTPYGPAPAGR